MRNFKRPKWAIYSNGIMVHKYEPKPSGLLSGIALDGMYMSRPGGTITLSDPYYNPFHQQVMAGQYIVTAGTDIQFQNAPQEPPRMRELRVGEYLTDNEVIYSQFTMPPGTTLVPDQIMGTGYTVRAQEMYRPTPVRTTPELRRRELIQDQQAGRPESSGGGMLSAIGRWFGI